MTLGFSKLLISRGSVPQLGALSLFTLAGLVIGVGSSGLALAGPVADSAQPVQVGDQPLRPTTAKLLTVKLGVGDEGEYLVAHPKWRESKATITLNPRRPDRTIEKTIYSQISVGVENEKALVAALATMPGDHAYRSFLDLPNVFVIEAASVEEAINLANAITDISGVEWAEVSHREPVGDKAIITNDPSARNQWHMLNRYAAPYNDGTHDHGIDNVHDVRGITGVGVVVGILEAGENSFYHTPLGGNPLDPADRDIHPDLVNRFNFGLSMPTSPTDTGYSHGVSVAGIVASEFNNGLAGYGVAFGAQLASLRNGNNVTAGEAFGHELQSIDIVNSSWGPDVERNPNNSTGKFIVENPDDFEIDIPQMGHGGMSRMQQIGLDRGLRFSRARKGRLYVFSAGNSSHFTSFARVGLGNAISLPGFGVTDGAPSYGYLDITSTDPADNNNDGVPDSFDLTGVAAANDRWSGNIGDRVNYNPFASMEKTFAIGSVGMDNLPSGYSTTGTAVFASAYSQAAPLGLEFTPEPDGGGWSGSGGTPGFGISTLEQINGGDSDLPFDCNTGTSGDALNGPPSGLQLDTDYILADAESCMFNGTSAAAPVAAGIFALMLQANPSLTIRDVQHIIQQTSRVIGYDPTNSYWPSVILDLGSTDDDDTNPPTPTFWSTNSAGVRHNDQYGFGIIDADAAVAAATTWTGAPALVYLDTGLITADDEGGLYPEEVTIEDATFEAVMEVSENLNTNRLVPGARQTISLGCIRENFLAESIELTLTFDGVGVGDLLIALQSPQGTISPLALPRGDDGQYIDYTFTTYNHWGELTGGEWNLIVQDYRPNEESPEGDRRADPFDPTDLGLEEVTYLGPFGMPGAPEHEELTLTSFRFKMASTQTDFQVFEGCIPGQTSCPADLDGNGIVEIFDLYIFIDWFTTGDPRADINQDGNISFADVGGFVGIFQPGFCNRSYNPSNGGFGIPTDGPITRPIGVGGGGN